MTLSPTLRVLRASRSTNRSAYGTSGIPLIELDGGAGPCIAFVAGVHGDEYEGQWACTQLARQLAPLLKRGRVLIVPAANPGACAAGQRLSPEDGLNLNKTFGISPARLTTEHVARLLEVEVFAAADYIIDIHSGGASLDYLPGSVYTTYRDDPIPDALYEMAAAFGFEHCMIFRSTDSTAAPAAASRSGALRLSAEIAGGARLSPALADRCLQGMLSVLAWLEMVDSAFHKPTSVSALDLSRPAATLYAETPGVARLTVTLGQSVVAGQHLGELFEPLRPNQPELAIHAPQAGIVVCLRPLARVDSGDCLVQIAPVQPLRAVLAKSV